MEMVKTDKIMGFYKREYMLHGLDLLPRADFNFKSWLSDPANGNDFLNRVMGSNTLMRQNHLR